MQGSQARAFQRMLGGKRMRVTNSVHASLFVHVAAAMHTHSPGLPLLRVGALYCSYPFMFCLGFGVCGLGFRLDVGFEKFWAQSGRRGFGFS